MYVEWMDILTESYNIHNDYYNDHLSDFHFLLLCMLFQKIVCSPEGLRWANFIGKKCLKVVQTVQKRHRKRPRRPSISTNETHITETIDLVFKDRSLKIRALVDSYSFAILKRVKSQLVPKTLNFFEKQRRVNVYEEMLSNYQNIMKRIATEPEACLPLSNNWSIVRKSYKEEARAKWSRQSRSKIKVF